MYEGSPVQQMGISREREERIRDFFAKNAGLPSFTISEDTYAVFVIICIG